MKKKPPAKKKIIVANEKDLGRLPPATVEFLKGVIPNSPDNIANGLGSALGFPGGGGIGYPGQSNPWSAPLSDTTTLDYNLRWFLVSNFRQLLNELYVEIGLIQTIVDVPIDDALRGGIEIRSKELDENEIKELMVSIDRDDDLTTFGQSAKWNRLFGGSGVIILTDQDPEKPLNINAITEDSPFGFRAVDMWELFYDEQNTYEYDPQIQQYDTEWYDYYGINLHASRVMPMKGIEPPSFIRPRLRGWGTSVVETLVRSINQYLKSSDLSFEVLDEFKLDVYKIKGLVNTLLSPGGDQKVRERVQLSNYTKNYQNALVMDSEDDFDHKQLSFAGLADAMKEIRMQVAADMRMPISKLFGSQSGGLNPDDETDIEVYNGMIESQVRGKLKCHLLKMCELKCQRLFGFVPDDLEIAFKPLRVLGAKEEEEVKTQKFTRLFQAKQAGEITLLEFRDACNKGNLFDIILDNMGDDLNADDPDVAAVLDGTAKEEQNIMMAGGGAKDTETPRAFSNSIAFEKASYDADGGDMWVDSRKEPFYTAPMGPNFDKELWKKASDASKAAYGKRNWKFQLWYYKKYGGRD